MDQSTRDASATAIVGGEAIAKVLESAARLGVELNENEAAEWVAAMATEASGGDLVQPVADRPGKAATAGLLGSV